GELRLQVPIIDAEEWLTHLDPLPDLAARRVHLEYEARQGGPDGDVLRFSFHHAGAGDGMLEGHPSRGFGGRAQGCALSPLWRVVDADCRQPQPQDGQHQPPHRDLHASSPFGIARPPLTSTTRSTRPSLISTIRSPNP